MRRIIYHYPLPLYENAVSGSQLRPVRMLDAFLELGYHVDIISGYSKQRKKIIKRIISNIEAGIIYDFMYCENSTMPTQLSDLHHIPLRPFFDFNFFAFLKAKNIPIGLFYRDIYWHFNNRKIYEIKKIISFFFYNYELTLYNKYLTKFYLPSYAMKGYLPRIKEDIIDILPPGHSKDSSIEKNIIDMEQNMEKENNNDRITFFYVGGLSEHYDLSLFIRCISSFDLMRFILCIRENEWTNVKHKYMPLPSNVEIVHANSKSLSIFYEQADIAMLYLAPDDYRKFAMPIKLFEYIGERKPILASYGTLAGEFVAENNIGWTIPYSYDALSNFLDGLSVNTVLKLKENLEKCAQENSWKSRALKVIYDLTGSKL